jgi:amino acid adenylation domain-containing protein
MAHLLHHLLSESAATHPDKTALVCKDESMTYAELDRESERLANGLTALGVERGARVGILMDRSLASIVAVFGILKTRAAYVPVDPASPLVRLNYIVEKCGVTSLLTMRKSLASLARAFPESSPLQSVIVIDGLESTVDSVGEARMVDWPETRTEQSAEPRREVGVDLDLAYILFTSGSTGNPKGVMLSHLNSLTFVKTARDFFQIGSNDRLSNVCPLHFDMSVFDLFVAISSGATVVIVPETTTMFPVKLAEAIARHKITVWNSVPSTLALLATYRGLTDHDLADLRLVLFAGEVFPLKYLRRLQDAIPGARFCNMYGQTEANSSTYFWIDDLSGDAGAEVPIGRPLPNFDVFALDENGRLITGPGREGELYVRGSTVASGYWGEPDQTAQSFVQNPLEPGSRERVYRTGDLVRLDADGNYVFVGRKDQMIKSRGYRVEIAEIEATLARHQGIQQAVVIPVPDEIVGHRISTIVVPVTAGALSKEDVLKHCRAHLPKYMVPEVVEFRHSLPATSSGKVDRKRLTDESVAAARNSHKLGRPKLAPAKLILNKWHHEKGQAFEIARILAHASSSEGLDVDRLRFTERGSLTINPAVGHIISVVRGHGTLRTPDREGRRLSLGSGVHVYLPTGVMSRLEADAGTEIIRVSGAFACQARGRRMLIRDEVFLAACASGSESFRWILTPQYLSRRIFVDRDAMLQSKSGHPVSWFRTTMFDVAGLPRNEDGEPVFKMSYNSRTEFNVCYEVNGTARVRMAKHPYSDVNQVWDAWLALDADSSYHLNEVPDEACLLVPDHPRQSRRNKHEVFIADGYVSLFCLFDPAATGVERHSPGEYSDYEPVLQALGTDARKRQQQELATYDDMVDRLSVAKAEGSLESLYGTAVWELYLRGRETQASIEADLASSLAAQGGGRDRIIASWVQGHGSAETVGRSAVPQ